MKAPLSASGVEDLHLFLNTSEEAQVTKQKALKVEGLGMHVFLDTQEMRLFKAMNWRPAWLHCIETGWMDGWMIDGWIDLSINHKSCLIFLGQFR